MSGEQWHIPQVMLIGGSDPHNVRRLIGVAEDGRLLVDASIDRDPVDVRATTEW